MNNAKKFPPILKDLVTNFFADPKLIKNMGNIVLFLIIKVKHNKKVCDIRKINLISIQ